MTKYIRTIANGGREAADIRSFLPVLLWLGTRRYADDYAALIDPTWCGLLLPPPHPRPFSPCLWSRVGEGSKQAPLIMRWLCGAGEYEWLGIGTGHPLSLGRGPGWGAAICVVGSNSEAYSDDREQVVAEKPLISKVCCRFCHDLLRGGMRTNFSFPYVSYGTTLQNSGC